MFGGGDGVEGEGDVFGECLSLVDEGAAWTLFIYRLLFLCVSDTSAEGVLRKYVVIESSPPDGEVCYIVLGPT